MTWLLTMNWQWQTLYSAMNNTFILIKGTPNRLKFSWLVTNQTCRVHGKTSSLSQSNCLVWTKRQQNIWPIPWKSQYTMKSQTINRVTYLNMLKETFHDDTNSDKWLQQDGATAHTAGEEKEWLKRRFSGRIIFHRSELQWPPRSPYLSPLYFYIWGFVKERVFCSRPGNIRELKVDN